MGDDVTTVTGVTVARPPREARVRFAHLVASASRFALMLSSLGAFFPSLAPVFSPSSARFASTHAAISWKSLLSLAIARCTPPSSFFAVRIRSTYAALSRFGPSRQRGLCLLYARWRRKVCTTARNVTRLRRDRTTRRTRHVEPRQAEPRHEVAVRATSPTEGGRNEGGGSDTRVAQDERRASEKQGGGAQQRHSPGRAA